MSSNVLSFEKQASLKNRLLAFLLTANLPRLSEVVEVGKLKGVAYNPFLGFLNRAFNDIPVQRRSLPFSELIQFRKRQRKNNRISPRRSMRNKPKGAI